MALADISAAGPLDPGPLLDTLLDQVRELLSVDTAAVLLLDESGSRLGAVAARGLEEEVRQGVRIPVGQGFAGRVAATKRPVLIEHVDANQVVNPLLLEKGIRSLLGVPLCLEGQVIGVLHVGSMRDRVFTRHEVDRLQELAGRVAKATQTRKLDAERAAVIALQGGLVPDALPTIPGLELAARYVPGENHAIGGDWYDVFTLPGGHVGVTIGDVAGRGLRAAVIMGRLRSALRAYALETRHPADVVTRLDEKFQHFEPYEMATLLYAVFEPTLDRVHISSAGHPPPVIRTPDGPSVLALIPPDPPLGVPMTALRQTTSFDIAPGTVLCFYTDGLVERRHKSLDDRLHLLRHLVTSEHPERVCASVMFTLIGSERTNDDVALLVVRREEASDHLHLELPARARSLESIRAAARRWLAVHGVDFDRTNDMLVALGEACANAVEHPYGSRQGTVAIDLEKADDDIFMVVRDTGRWRTARGMNRGRGMTVIEHFTDEVRFERDEMGTTVTMRCTIRRSAQA